MDEIERRRQERKFKRYRTLGTNNPFCRICGKNKLFSRYEYHHPGGKANTNATIFVCSDCHNEAHEMDKDLDPIPPHIDPVRASFVRRLQGLSIVLRMVGAQVDEINAWLLSDVRLPSLPIATEGASAFGKGKREEEGDR
jgi:hypothetical protein